MIDNCETFLRLFDNCSYDYSDRIISELKEHKRPIVLFGTGEVASRVLAKLKKYDVVPDYQMVDPEFEENAVFEYPNFSKINMINRDACLVAGIRNYPHVRNVGIKLGIENTVFFDNIFDTEIIRKDFFAQNIISFFLTYDSFLDDKSKETMIAYLKTNFTHDPSYMFSVWDQGMPYFSFDGLKISDNECFVNCGAYDGDTISDFLKIGNYKKIYALEADNDTFKLLDDRFNQDNIIKINKAVYSDSNGIQFKSFCNPSYNMSRGMSKIVKNNEEGSQRIETCTIDDIVSAEETVTLINMDIEGAEISALKGGKRTIIKDRPKLAISAYHKEDDLISIPSLIKSFDNTYKFALRAYCPWSEELVLYAY